MAQWAIDYDVKDSKGFPSTMRVPVTGGTVPTGYTAYADAVGAAIFGASLPSFGGYVGANLVIPLPVTQIAPQAGSEVRNKWQATMLNGGVVISKFGIPVRNPADALIVAGTKMAGDVSVAAFTGALAALLNTGGTIHMVEFDEGTSLDAWAPVLATVRSRKRPRVGGSR